MNKIGEDERKKMRNFILLSLGAPVVKIELDDQQLDLCINRICDLMDQSPKAEDYSESHWLMIAQDGALALAKIMLGRVRAKFGGVGDMNGGDSTSRPACMNNLSQPLDGGQLLVEGEKQYQDWQRKVYG